MKGREARRKSTATTPRKLARARSTLFLTTAQDEKSRRRTRRVGGCNRTGGGCADATATLGNSHQEWAGEEATQLQNGCREVSHFGPRYKMELGRATCHQRRLQQPNKSRIMRCLRSACLLRVGQSPGSSPMCAMWILKHSLKNTAWTTAQPQRTCLKEQRPTTPRKLRARPSPCYRGTSGQEPWQDLGRAIIRHHSKNEYLTRLQFDGGLCGVAVHVVNMQESGFHGYDATCSVDWMKSISTMKMTMTRSGGAMTPGGLCGC